jgi:hypothetical protein
MEPHAFRTIHISPKLPHLVSGDCCLAWPSPVLASQQLSGSVSFERISVLEPRRLVYTQFFVADHWNVIQWKIQKRVGIFTDIH